MAPSPPDSARLQVHFERFGTSSNRTPVLLIHGGGSTIESNWSRMIPALQGTREVIAVELQGHGRSPATDRTPTFQNSAADLVDLLDRLAVRAVDVVGFSNGGNTAIRLAQLRPDLVRRQVIAATPQTRDSMVEGFWDGLASSSIEDLPTPYREADENATKDPEHYKILFETDTIQMLRFEDMSDEEVRRLKTPTLYLAGDHDVVTATHVAQMAALTPGARLLIVPGTHGDYLGEILAAPTDLRAFELTLPWILDFLDH